MKFKTFKILIAIIALIQFNYSSTLESRTNTNTMNASHLTAKSQIKSSTTNKNTSTLKNKMLSKNKSTSTSLSKLLKRSAFYEANGILPPPFKIPEDQIPKTINQPLVPDPHAVKGDMIKVLEDWQMVSSEAFSDKGKFPDVFVTDTNSWYKIKLDNMKFRVNDAHKRIPDQKDNLPHDKNCFWFRLSGLNLYYSSTKSDYNILGAIQIEEVIGVISLEGDHTGYHCYIVKDHYDTEWKICSASKEKRNLWVCTIEQELGVKQEPFCNGGMDEKVVINHDVSIKIYILILFYFIYLYS